MPIILTPAVGTLLRRTARDAGFYGGRRCPTRPNQPAAYLDIVHTGTHSAAGRRRSRRAGGRHRAQIPRHVGLHALESRTHRFYAAYQGDAKAASLVKQLSWGRGVAYQTALRPRRCSAAGCANSEFITSFVRNLASRGGSHDR
jgi:hypothetical protein